jgi:hypothetical protein
LPAVDELPRPLLPTELTMQSTDCPFEPGSAGHTLWLIARQRVEASGRSERSVARTAP